MWSMIKMLRRFAINRLYLAPGYGLLHGPHPLSNQTWWYRRYMVLYFGSLFNFVQKRVKHNLIRKEVVFDSAYSPVLSTCLGMYFNLKGLHVSSPRIVESMQLFNRKSRCPRWNHKSHRTLRKTDEKQLLSQKSISRDFVIKFIALTTAFHESSDGFLIPSDLETLNVTFRTVLIIFPFSRKMQFWCTITVQ